MLRPSTSLGICFAAVVACAAPPREVPIPNGGFTRENGGAPEGWTLVGAPGAKLALEEGPGPESRRLRLENPAAGGETTLQSAPLKLQVGHLYRLSAHLRTREVHPDPVARYPTALGACLSMANFPFTNASSTVAGNGQDRVSVTFFATASTDRVQLHLGRNGRTAGTAWFDDLRLEEVDDIRDMVPAETVTWAGKGFRYEDGGWINVHIEGAPYERGHQYGQLVGADLARFVEKLAIQKDKEDPGRGWSHARTLADALMLRKFDPEFLEEMKGIADGAAAAGAKFRGRNLDLLDVVTANSDIDLGELEAATRVTASPLSGRTFQKAEDEAARGGKGDHCSSFVATRSATRDGRFVMGQMFMWGGYTGVEWNVMLDVQPAKGHRFVMQTFPGGISSGTDWYVNDAGVVIGETTVAQTPFEPDGTPEANRIRKAAQYASSIDEVASILKERNNGLYTNDWTIADAKTDEGAVFLLGTAKSRLWRTGSNGHPADTPGGLKDFVWANNNNRDLEVRKESVPNPDNAPVDLAFNTWNRDIAFWNAYKDLGKGGFDLPAAARLQASSPINRPHACDGKLTTAEMAEHLMFVAHYGKTTLREKWVGGRYIPDLPMATPHLTLGFTTFNPVLVAEKLKGQKPLPPPAAEPVLDPKGAGEALVFPKALLWSNTVFPATDGDNWFVSGSAAYHGILGRLPEAPGKAFEAQRDALADLAARCSYLTFREGPLAPAKAITAYDRYGAYQFPRIKGTFLLHQLRLLLGNQGFAKVMGKVHGTFQGRPMGTADFIREASAAAGRDLAPFVRQWVDREDLPDPAVTLSSAKGKEGWILTLKVDQKGWPWHFVTMAEIQGAKGSRLERLEVKGGSATFTFHEKEKPVRVVFNASHDVPVAQENPYILPNQMDDFDHLLLVFGTSREVEANRSLVLNYRDMVADAFTETLPPVKPDAEVSEADLAQNDLMVFGGPDENALLARIVREKGLPVTFGRDFFTWQGRTYGRADDGLALALPNPYNPRRTLYLYTANSRLQLWHMTHAFQRGLPAWARFRGPAVQAKGYGQEARFVLEVK